MKTKPIYLIGFLLLALAPFCLGASLTDSLINSSLSNVTSSQHQRCRDSNNELIGTQDSLNIVPDSTIPLAFRLEDRGGVSTGV